MWCGWLVKGLLGTRGGAYPLAAWESCIVQAVQLVSTAALRAYGPGTERVPRCNVLDAGWLVRAGPAPALSPP